MTQPVLLRSWRTARVATAALALTAAALTVSGSASGHGAPLAAPGSVAQVAAPCSTGVSANRVRADSSPGTVDPNDLTLAQTQQAEAKLAARARQRGFVTGRASLPKVKINVYVHVIETDGGKGGVSKSRIKKQISVLNKAYGGKSSSSSTKTGFSFKLKATDKTMSRPCRAIPPSAPAVPAPPPGAAVSTPRPC